MLFLRKYHRAKSILKVLDPMTCPEQYLDLLRDRLGFEPTIKIETSALRVILKAFPWLIKYKGSMKAVSTSIRIALLLQGINSSTFGLFVDKQSNEIQIFIDRDIDTAILEEIFRHIAPVGFTFSLTKATIDERITTLSGDSVVFAGLASTQTLSSLKNQPYVEEIEPGMPALGLDPPIPTEGYGEEFDTWSIGSLGIQEITKALDGDEEGYEEEIQAEGNITQLTDSGELPQTEEP